MPPIGIRQRNPGNLRPAPDPDNWIPWGGVQPDNGSGYLVFATMEDGIRAATINWANGYRKRGIRTIRQGIHRWAPAIDNNNPTSYARFVAEGAGYPADRKLKLDDPLLLRRLMPWIFRKECGWQNPNLKTDWFTQQQFEAGLRRALTYLYPKGIPS